MAIKMWAQHRKIKLFLIITSVLILAVALCACVKKSDNQEDLTAGSSVEFGGLEIQIGEQDTVELVRVTNQQSKYFTKTVIKVPVVIKNLSDEPNSLILPYYQYYDPNGNVLPDLSREYMDYEEANWTGELQPEEAKNAYFYILYSELGTYTIEFSKAGEETVRVKIEITDNG